jgi:hypothetical protein
MRIIEMLRDAAVARVKQLLGFKQDLDPEIVQAMIETQEDLERSSELPFFLRKNYVGLVTAENNPVVNVPADFIREWDDDQMFVMNELLDEFPVVKDQEGYLRLRWPINQGQGMPQKYARVYREFHFYPTPNLIYELNGAYYAKAESLSSNIENVWLKELPFILIARSGLLVGGGLRDKEGIAIFSTMNDMMTTKLHQMTAADDAAGSRPVVGGDED